MLEHVLRRSPGLQPRERAGLAESDAVAESFS